MVFLNFRLGHSRFVGPNITRDLNSSCATVLPVLSGAQEIQIRMYFEIQSEVRINDGQHVQIDFGGHVLIGSCYHTESEMSTC